MSELWQLAVEVSGPLTVLCAGLVWFHGKPAWERWRRIRREWPRRVRGAE